MSLVLCVDNAAEFMGAVEAFAEDVQRGCLDAVRDACLDGAETARSSPSFQDQTGKLRGSIRVLGVARTGEGAEGSFGTRVRYGQFVEGGTSAHEIRARRASALRWEQGGEIHFARLVHHPGTRARPFMGPGALKAERVLYARAESLTAHAIVRFGGRR